VTSFGRPSEEEMAHDYLWRVHKACPRRGIIGIFNRSHYEDVLVVRVHDIVPKAVWSKRYDQINAFEKLLADSGVTIVKFFLLISPEEQTERVRHRPAHPARIGFCRPSAAHRRGPTSRARRRPTRRSVRL